MMLKLTEEQLDWLVERILESPGSPKGGRPVACCQPADSDGLCQNHCMTLTRSSYESLARAFLCYGVLMLSRLPDLSPSHRISQPARCFSGCELATV